MKILCTLQDDIKIKRLYCSGKTAQQIADSFGWYKQVILNSLKRSGVPRREDWDRASGTKNGKWKGGVRMIKGYRHLLLPESNLARKDGYVSEHRLVMQKHLGRKLKPKEVVHHLDENKLNNKISNLKIYSNNGKHRKEHCKKQGRNNKGKFI